MSSHQNKKNTFQLSLLEVTCAGCVRKIENALAKLPNIHQAQVNFPTRRVDISGNISPNEVINTIQNIGYDAQLIAPNASEHQHTPVDDAHVTSHRIRQTWVAAIMSTFLMFASMGNGLPALSQPNGQIAWGITALITLLGMAYSGKHIYAAALKGLRFGHTSMDTLIALGTGAAWIYSCIITAHPTLVAADQQHLYFEAALMIIALVNLGSVLEMRATSKTSQAIEKLIGLQPQSARRVNPDNTETDIPLAELKINDLIRIRPGEKIPVDGIITEGQAIIDESMLTGEPIPQQKTENDPLFGGTINTNTSFLMQATQVGENTLLAKIISMVRQAQSTKPPIAKLADTISSYFVPTAISIAILTAIAWALLGHSAGFVLQASMSVLVIACPCALGLAAPISVIAGMGKAAEHGILIRNGNALQQTAKLTTIVLDKTGTLTQGKPTLTDQLTIDTIDQQTLLQLAASLEATSEHPLAQAIVQAANAQNIALIKATNVAAITGQGIEGTVNDQTVFMGNNALMQARHITTSNFQTAFDQAAEAGKTPLYIAIEGELAGLLIVSDPIREDAHTAIAGLKQLGITPYMLTGDNAKTAHAVASTLGIEHVIPEVLPDEKAAHVQRLQALGNCVAMVGDGINDAPALTQADIGFAIGCGTDVAIESADITLVNSTPSSIISAIRISAATMRNIKQNLWGAFLYNSIGIPIAAGLLYPVWGLMLNPMIAATAMAASSLTVVSNANRLRYFRL